MQDLEWVGDAEVQGDLAGGVGYQPVRVEDQGEPLADRHAYLKMTFAAESSR